MRSPASIQLQPRRAPALRAFQAAEPLWKRAPTRDEHGRPLSDFMMLIPKLREQPHSRLLQIADRIYNALAYYGNAVVFADLNPRLNVLWVTVRPVPGICLDVACAIQLAVPEARLVAERRIR